MDLDADLPAGAAIPPQGGAVDPQLWLRTRTGTLEIQSARYTQGYVTPASNCFGWVNLTRLDVTAGTTSGEHVGHYVKGYRHPGATATMWPVCFEASDWSGIGHLWGAEVDVMSIGEDANHSRIGVGVVFGEAVQKGAAGPTYKLVRFNYGLVGLPFRRKVDEGTPQERIVADNVAHDCFLTTFVPCKVFAAAPAGSWITFDDGMNVGEVFGKQTGYQLQGRRDIIGDPPDWTRAALAFQRDTGELCQFGKTIIPPVPPQFRPAPGESAADWAKKLAAWRTA